MLDALLFAPPPSKATPCAVLIRLPLQTSGFAGLQFLPGTVIAYKHGQVDGKSVVSTLIGSIK
jgi:hypothetical protein